VEKQRVAAEKEAADARAKIRKLNEELVIENARREGRRLGLQEGLNRGRDLILSETQARPPQPRSRRPVSSIMDRSSAYTAETYSDSDDDSRTVSTVSRATVPMDRRKERPPSRVPTEPTSPPLPVPEPRQSTRPPSLALSYMSKPPSIALVRNSAAPSLSEVAPSAPPSVHATPRAPSAMSDYGRQYASPAPPHHEPSRPPSSQGWAHHEPPRPPSSQGRQQYQETSRPPSVQARPSYQEPSRPPSAQEGRHSPISRMHAFIPPDNLIPNLEEDGVIRLPPPHGFQRQVSTPEPPPSPSLPPVGEPYYAPQSAGGSQSPSTGSRESFSHYDILKDPGHGGVALTPALSAIEEVSSHYSRSPYHGNPFDAQSAVCYLWFT